MSRGIGEPLVTTVLLAWLLHHAIMIKGTSYWLRDHIDLIGYSPASRFNPFAAAKKRRGRLMKWL